MRQSSSIRIALKRAIAVSAMTLSIWLAAAPVGAQVLDVAQPEVEKGKWEFATLNGFQSGLPRNDAGALRHDHQLQLGYGITDYFALKLIGNAERPRDGRLEITALAVEGTFQFAKAEQHGFAAAWLTTLDFGTLSDGTNTVIFGPIFKKQFEPFTIVTNTFLEKTFGRNREEGITFAYAWQALYAINKQLSIGLEGVGSVPNLGDSPSVSEQDHRLGPMLAQTFELAGKRELTVETGMQFGLTSAAPVTALKINAKLAFE